MILYHGSDIIVKNPDILVTIEIREKFAFIRGNQTKGAGGMPTGTAGKAAILMPNGATTSNTQDDYKLRKAMIESGKVEAILALPNKLFSNVWLLYNLLFNSSICLNNSDFLLR